MTDNKYSDKISQINSSLKWLKQYHPDQYEAQFLKFVDVRRELYKLQNASRYNAGIAAFGASQVGKSYLMNNILQKDGKPFMVKEDGKEYNYVENINPIVNMVEATGVVTRFSSSCNTEMFAEEHPIMMKTLSIVDIILILCDGYYNDIIDYDTEGEQKINELADNIYHKYVDAQPINNNPLTPDGILELKHYFREYINNAQVFNKSVFFDKLALVADKIPCADWSTVFSVLWNRTPQLTDIFNRLVDLLQRFGFAKYVYLTIDALLHKGNNINTIMSVDCLNKLGDEDKPNTNTAVFIKQENGFQNITDVNRSELCALCAEVIFKIDEEYYDSLDQYDLTMIKDAAIKNRLNHTVKKDILEKCDLLDFPGAKSREKQKIANLIELSVRNRVFLRGKVAYLFNMYNNSHLLNILLFSQDYEDHNVTELYLMVENWINRYVGKTPEERKTAVDKLQGNSPFFFIATKFNVDMEDNTNDAKNELNALPSRWFDRYNKVLYQKCFSGDSVSWVNNFTATEQPFQNSFLLRDFKYSGPKKSRIYDGFVEKGKETQLTLKQELYDNLRTTFIENENVKRFFSNPSLAWEVAATMNNDGALYIIEKLSEVSGKIIDLRNYQAQESFNKASALITNIMSTYYVPDNQTERLQQDIRKARQIMIELDFTCNADNYFMGHLLHALQLTETQCYNIIHKVINSGELDKSVVFNDYEIIYNTCSKYGFPITADMDSKQKWNQFISAYGLSDKQEAETYLASKGIDANKLFLTNFQRKKNSCVIADAIFDHWEQHINSVDFLTEISAEKNVNSVALSNLTKQIVSVAKNQQLADKMAQAIQQYTDNIKIVPSYESLIADILADYINNFVLDIGYNALSEEQIHSAREIAQTNHLPAFKYIDTPLPLINDEDSITALFSTLNDNPNALTLSFEQSYNRWKEYLVVAFISQVIVPDQKTLEANQALKQIFDNLK